MNVGRLIHLPFCLGLTMASAFAAELVSWRDLNTRLSTVSEEPLVLSRFMVDPFVRDVVERKEADVLLEMSSRQEYPLLVLVGFLGMSKLFPDRAEGLAYKIILEADAVSPLHEAIFRQVGRVISFERFDAIFRESIGLRPNRPENMGLLISEIRFDWLDRWFHSPSRSAGLVDNEAWVLIRLFESYIANGQQPSPLMISTLQRFGELPGKPRVAFVLFAPEGDNRYQHCLEQVLEDPTLLAVDLALLLSRKHAYIQSHIDLTKLDIAQGRRDRMRSYLDRRYP